MEWVSWIRWEHSEVGVLRVHGQARHSMRRAGRLTEAEGGLLSILPGGRNEKPTNYIANLVAES